jgi:putative serine protease PepD
VSEHDHPDEPRRDHDAADDAAEHPVPATPEALPSTTSTPSTPSTPGHPVDDADDHPTQPLALSGAAPAPVTPSWAPPVGPPPATQRWHDYATPDRGGQPAHAFAPAHRAAPAKAERARPSGWIWPVLVAVALVVGALGGVVGGTLVASDDDGGSAAPPAYEGLSDENIVELPPVGTGGGVRAVAEALLPSTVQISAEFQGQADGATGSGFVLDDQGHVVTNNHVVESAAESDGPIEVVDQDGNVFEADLVGRSPVYDLAVLDIGPDSGLPPAALGSSKRLRVGDGVVAIGSPLGLSSTVTAGIVSALNRPVTTGSPGDDSSYINAVQTDAAINPGNSGGPLVNLRGQVVGVNSAIATSGGGTIDGEAGNIGVGFAIPVEQVRITADQILKTGEARYPVIGASVGNASSDDGALIDDVNADAPAEAAGLEAGDVVVEVDGQRVTDSISLIVTIRTHQPGEVIELVYLRDGRERTARIELDSEVG